MVIHFHSYPEITGGDSNLKCYKFAKMKLYEIFKSDVMKMPW